MGVSLYQFWGSIPSSKQRRHGCKCWGKIPPGVGVWSFSLCIFLKWYAQFSDTPIFTPGIDHCSDLFLSLGLHPPQEAPKFLLLEASSFLQNAQKKGGQLKMLDHDGSSIQIKTYKNQVLSWAIRWCLVRDLPQKCQMSQANSSPKWRWVGM